MVVHYIAAPCHDNQLKLVDSQEYNKCLEICSNQRWETLSFLNWTDYNTDVVCNELGKHLVIKHCNDNYHDLFHRIYIWL